MRKTYRLIARGLPTAGCLALIAIIGMSATAAYAQCNVAGLVGSSDASTTQALESIRDRRMQVAQTCPPGTMASAGGMCVPMAGAVTPTSAQAAPAASPAAAPKAAKKKAAAPKPASAPPPGVAYGGLKDDFAEAPRVRTYGVWAEGYGEYERRNDVSGTQGNTQSSQTIKFTSWGVVSGIDHTHLRSPREGIMIGALAGYNDTHGRYSGDLAADIPARSQDIEGAMLGLYGSYFHRGFAIDVLGKVDLFDFDQSVVSGCQTTIDTAGSTSLTNFLIASNIYYRHGGGHLWLEPTAGIRYVRSDFGSGATTLGVADGESLRLQAGVRVGSDWVGYDRRFWTVSFLAALYSDVLVDGFTIGGGTVVLDTDEGKLRALGQLRVKTTTYHGVSYYGQAEVRGGEDYFGVAGKLGVRYDW